MFSLTEDKASEALKERLLKADEEIFSLLTTKVSLPTNYFKPGHNNLEQVQLYDSVTQLLTTRFELVYSGFYLQINIGTCGNQSFLISLYEPMSPN